jgi:fatty acid desaturase
VQQIDHHVPARSELVQTLQPFAQPVTRTGVLLFVADYAVLIAALALALLADNVLLRIVAAVIAGFKMGGLYSLAHDAAHNSLTASRRLNRLLGVLAHLPLFFNHRLWLHDHNATHHPGTNGPQKDAFTPMSLEPTARRRAGARRGSGSAARAIRCRSRRTTYSAATPRPRWCRPPSFRRMCAARPGRMCC